MAKKVYNKERINLEDYVNKNTGETLASEHPEITSVNKETDLVIVDSEEYVILDSKAHRYIIEHFSNTEVGRILQMTDMIQGIYNILTNKDTKEAHTKSTLMTELEYSRNIFAKFIKKLYDHNIINFIKSNKGGKDSVFIMLNPTLARNRKTFHKDCLVMFDELRNKL